MIPSYRPRSLYQRKRRTRTMPMKYPYRRTPVYRDLVPVHPGFSFRAMNQTPQKPEWKYIDTYSLLPLLCPTMVLQYGFC